MTAQHPELALVFPGQGSQSVGMLNALAAAHPQVGEVFAEASDALGFDLWQLVSSGPEDQLNLTLNTQPAMLAAGVATYRVWQAQGGPTPTWLAGHSLGEYSALVCAGALAFSDAIQLVRERARFMQEAVPAGQGAMAAVLGLDDAAVEAVCAAVSNADSRVTPANFNAPGQVVIAGHAAAVAEAVSTAKAAGAKRAVLLPVSVPSHCPLMQPAAERLAEQLAQTAVNVPQMTVIHNADVASHASADAVRDALARQLFQPVRWVESVQAIHAQGATQIIECGPGKVLLGLNKRIAASAHHASLFDPASLATALEKLQ